MVSVDAYITVSKGTRSTVGSTLRTNIGDAIFESFTPSQIKTLGTTNISPTIVGKKRKHHLFFGIIQFTRWRVRTVLVPIIVYVQYAEITDFTWVSWDDDFLVFFFNGLFWINIHWVSSFSMFFEKQQSYTLYFLFSKRKNWTIPLFLRLWCEVWSGIVALNTVAMVLLYLFFPETLHKSLGCPKVIVNHQNHPNHDQNRWYSCWSSCWTWIL